MICHILLESEYSYRYYKLIRKFFSLTDHCFVVHGKGLNFDSDKYEYEEAIYTTNFTENEVLKIFEQASTIIVNGLFSHSIVNFFFYHPRYLEKLSWFIWGDDIFPVKEKDFDFSFQKLSFEKIIKLARNIKNNIKISFAVKAIPLKTSCHEMQRSFVIKDMKSIISLEKDYDIVNHFYQTQAKHIYGLHPLFIDWNNLNKLLIIADDVLKKNNYNLLIGNSGSITNKHIEAFRLFQHLDISNANLYCPLSYGDPYHINQVIKLGSNLFGECFNPITNILSTSEYMNFLTKINVAIMNHDIQEGVGTIATLIILGCKIYMKKHTPSYDFFSGKGIKIFDINDIICCTNIQKLFDYEEEIRKNNREIAINIFSETGWYKMWNNIFQTL